MYFVCHTHRQYLSRQSKNKHCTKPYTWLQQAELDQLQNKTTLMGVCSSLPRCFFPYLFRFKATKGEEMWEWISEWLVCHSGVTFILALSKCTFYHCDIFKIMSLYSIDLAERTFSPLHRHAFGENSHLLS